MSVPPRTALSLWLAISLLATGAVSASHTGLGRSGGPLPPNETATLWSKDPDSQVEEVVPYYDLGDGHRLDLAGVTTDDEIVVAVEVERVNNDVYEAAPADYDKIAACDVEEAIWVVMTQSAGHTVLEALNDPPHGVPRVEKSYASTTPPQQFRIDTPGLTAMYPAAWLRDRDPES